MIVVWASVVHSFERGLREHAVGYGDSLERVRCIWVSGALAALTLRTGRNKRKRGDELWMARFATREIRSSKGQSVYGRRTRDTEDVVEVVGGEHLAYLPCTNVFLALSGE